MKPRKVLTVIFTCLIFFYCKAYAHEESNREVIKLSYADIPKLIDQNSSKLQSFDKKIEASQEREALLKESFYPKFSLHSSLESFRFGSTNVKTQPTASALASINLYNGGQDQIADALNENSASLFKSERSAIRKQKLAAARKLFWEHVYFAQTLAIREAGVVRLKNMHAKLAKRINAGTAAKSEGMEFKIKLFELERDIALERQKREEIKVELFTELGIANHHELETVAIFEDEKFWRKSFLHDSTHHKDFLNQFDRQKAYKQLSIQKLEGKRRPVVEAFGGIRQNSQREEDFERSWQRLEQFIGVGISINLDSSSQIRKEKAALLAEIDSVELEKKAELADIEKHLVIDLKAIEFFLEKVAVAPQHQELLEEQYKLIMEDYNFGIKDSEDVFKVFADQLRIKLEHAETVKELNTLISHMESYFG